MTHSEHALDRALDATRRALDPTGQDRARVRAAFGARLAALGAVAAGLADGAANAGPGSQAASLAGDVMGWLAKVKTTGLGGLISAGVLVGAGAGAGYVAARQSAPPAAVAAQVAPAARPAALTRNVANAPAAPSALEPEPSPAKVEPRQPRGIDLMSVSAPPLAASGSAFDEELALLRRAERALRSNNPQLTLALLAELDRTIPRGALLEERAAARVLAACQADGERGRAVAERFIRESPSSVYTARIRAMCALSGARPTESVSPDTNFPEGRSPESGPRQ